MIYVGMSGFSYPSWKGVFYPDKTKASDLLRRYAERLNAVEINAFFRRRPDPALCARWRDEVPDGFRFALKANAGITQFKRFRGTEADVADFSEKTSGFGDKRGPVLYQARSDMKLDDRMEPFLDALPSGVQHAFEPRHPTFDDPAFFELLARYGVAWCCNDEVFDPVRYVITAPFAYLRLRRADYRSDELRSLANLVRRLDVEDAYCFFMHEDDPDAAMQAVRFLDWVSA